MELEIIECTAEKLYPVNILYCVILKGHADTLALALKKIINKIKYMTIRLFGLMVASFSFIVAIFSS